MIDRKNLPVPYSRLLKLVRESIQFETETFIDQFDVMAVVIKESMATGYFCECDALFRSNILAVTVGTGVPRKIFTDQIRVKHGRNRGSIPKFSFESQWFKLVKDNVVYSHLPLAFQALLGCGVGLGNQSAYWLVFGKDVSFAEQYLSQYLADESFQLRQIYWQLETAARCVDATRESSFEKFKSGEGVKGVTGYGERVASLSDQLRSAYAVGS